MKKPSVARFFHGMFLAGLGASSVGCQSEEAIEPPRFQQIRAAVELGDVAECVAADQITATGPAILINDPAVLSSPFSLRSALDKIVETGGQVGSAEGLMGSLLESFAVNSLNNPDSGFAMHLDVRTAEAQYDPASAVDDLVPVAVLNRFDLAPTDGTPDCGEYRVIYAKPGTAGPAGRFFVIFEARYPNPSLALGREGCRPVAALWGELADPALTDAQRVETLRTFFYDGLERDGVQLPAVLHFDNFKGERGQVRTNHFLSFNKWQLREFRTGHGPEDEAVFTSDTVKGVPLAELYGDGAAPSPSDPDLFGAMRSRFQADFLLNQVGLLVAPEVNGAETPDQIRLGISTRFPNAVYEFQSDAQGLADDPLQRVGEPSTPGDPAHFKTKIQAAIPAGLDLTADHVINRAGALTCGGCHFFSNNREIAPGVTWPTAFFTHINEGGNLSSALSDVFLPARRTVMVDFLCNPPPPECQVDTDCADGEICEAGECVEDQSPECLVDADCEAGQVCREGLCLEAPEPGACGEPRPIEGPGRFRGTTRGAEAIYGASCGRGATGPEKVFRFSPEANGRFCFDTRGSRFDTVLHVRQGDCDEGREIRCNDNRRRLRRRSAVSVRARAGQDYYIFVDGRGRAAGDFVLNVNPGSCRRVLRRPAVARPAPARPAPARAAPEAAPPAGARR